MNKICDCGGAGHATRKLAVFDAARLLDAPFEVILHEAVNEVFCTKCGHVEAQDVPHVSNLIAVAAVLRACHSMKLCGAEVRFLRKSLWKSGKEFARELSVSAEHLSRWENDAVPIPLPTEKLLRTAVCVGHLEMTLKLGVDPKRIFTMPIVPARDASAPVRFDLDYSLAPHRSPMIAIQATVDEPTWRIAAM